jgi:NADH pyrophosphatase NudC (nudix superfamily)
LVYAAAILIVIGVALFVAAPLGDGVLGGRRGRRRGLEAERLEHERGLAVQGLRELEFDREMGKLSDADYTALRESLMERALAASTALERMHTEQRAAVAPRSAAVSRPRLVKTAASSAASASSTPGGPARIRFCPQCGAKAMPGNFCSECGAPLSIPPRAAAQAER